MRLLPILPILLLLADSAAASCPSVTWPERQHILTNRWVQQVVALDINEDGKMDLAGLYGAEGANPYTIVTWLGAGDGTFGAATVVYSNAWWIPSLATADVDQDGHADLISSIGYSLLIFHGTGSGFGTPEEIATTGAARDLFVGNFDGDSAPELIASASNDGFVMIFDNTAGTFVRTGTLHIGLYPLGLVTADFNEDGLYDIAVVRRLNNDDAMVLLFLRATATVFAPPSLLPSGRLPLTLRKADFNLDGHMDLLTGNWTDGTLTVYRNNGSGAFTASTIDIAMPRRWSNVGGMLTDDVNGDGIPDLTVAATNGGWLTTMTGAGDGTFRTPTWQYAIQPFDSRGFYSLAAADFDNDGDRDLAVGGGSSLTIATPSCATQVTLTPKSWLITVGQNATLLVDISGFSPATPQPHGSVTLRNGNATVETLPVDATGRATFTVPGLTVGEHSFAVDFTGNGDLSPATSAVMTQRVTTLSTRTILTTPASPPVYGSEWPVTVTVEGPTYTSEEFVVLTVDGVSTRFYNSQPYKLRLTPGPHTISAAFEGTYYRPPSTSDTVNVTAPKATPALTLKSGASTVRLGQQHMLGFALTGVPSGMTGSIQLFSGTTLLASTAVSSNGLATVPVTLPRGAHAVRAAYTGDANYASASLDLTLTVAPDVPLWIEARALTANVRIAYVLPAGATIRALYRSPGDGFSAILFDQATGIDPAVLQRGTMYEYQLEVSMPDGSRLLSNIDGALLFTDDPLAEGSPIKRAHFTELRDAINLRRRAVGLYPFQFDDTFNSSPLIRALHMETLRSYAADARARQGLTTPPFDATVAAGLAVRRQHILELRELLR